MFFMFNSPHYSNFYTVRVKSCQKLLYSVFPVLMLTLSQMTYFRQSQTQEFADHNFKFDENGRKFSKLV